tara:strand:- start:1840 stop:2925 length:1086 start_codon:yes stop_codon:yes gene_type:complete
MNKILNKYIINNFLKITFNTILIFFSLGILIALFQEIEFFKDLNVSFGKPLSLALTFVPNLAIELLPFIIFISTMIYLVNINNSKELISLKIYGFSNMKIIFLLSVTVFIFGLIVIVFINPITSSMIKYYEKEKSKFSRDVDHLISINKNGVWIKEKSINTLNLIYAKELKSNFLFDVSIYQYDIKSNKLLRIESDNADISNSEWKLYDVTVHDSENPGKINKIPNYKYFSFYNLVKINSSYKNLDTISFIDLINNYDVYLSNGYSENDLNAHLNSYISLPIFLVLMVILASIFGLITNKKVKNTYYFFISIITCVLVYYFKDLSIALGQTNKISIILSVWMPIIAVSLFCSIGMIRLNEK